MVFLALAIATVLLLRRLHAVRWKIYRFVLLWWATTLKTQRMCIAKYWTVGAGRRLIWSMSTMGKQKNIGILAL